MSKSTLKEKSTWEKLKDEETEFWWTLVLDWFDLVMFKKVIDGEDDYYYQYEKLDGEVYESSAVIGFTPQKWRILDDEYARLDSLWIMNSQNPINILNSGNILHKNDNKTFYIYSAWKINNIEHIDLIYWYTQDFIRQGAEKIILNFLSSEVITNPKILNNNIIKKLELIWMNYEINYWSIENFAKEFK